MWAVIVAVVSVLGVGGALVMWALAGKIARAVDPKHEQMKDIFLDAETQKHKLDNDITPAPRSEKDIKREMQAEVDRARRDSR